MKNTKDKHVSFLEKFGFHEAPLFEKTQAVKRWAIALDKKNFLEKYAERFNYTDDEMTLFKDAFIVVDAYQTAKYNQNIYMFDYVITVDVSFSNKNGSHRCTYMHFQSNTKEPDFVKGLQEKLRMFE